MTKKLSIKPPGWQSEPPDALILTMPVAFFLDRAGNPSAYYVHTGNDPIPYTYNKKLFLSEYMEKFNAYFERFMRQEDVTWNFKKKTLPTQDVAWVYLVWDGKIQFRLNFVCYERNTSKEFSDDFDGRVRKFPNMNWIIMAGPAIRPPYEMPMKGFQGHRYTQKLF